MPPRLPPFVANELAPPSVRSARRELATGGWRGHVTVGVVAAEIVVFLCVAVMALPFAPLLFAPFTLFEGWQLPLAVITALGLGLGAAALAWAEWTRRAWKARRPVLVAKLAPYDQPVADARWRDAQALLLELRGPDPESDLADGVYRLTLALSEAFVRRERVAAAVRAAQGLGEEGVDALSELLRQHDEALNRTLVDLKQTCAVALTDASHASRATRQLLDELNQRLVARSEVEDAQRAEVRTDRAVRPKRPIRVFES